ncbi:MAG: trypsin-like peptidase domain-containing protein [Acidobacteriota bacterium]
MTKPEPEDYLNLSHPNRVDEFAIGEPTTNPSDEPASRAKYIVLVIFGLIALSAIMSGLFLHSIIERTNESEVAVESPSENPDVKIIEPAPGSKENALRSNPAPAIAPLTSTAPSTTPSPTNTTEPALRPVSTVLRELTPAIGMVVVRTASGVSSGSGFVIRSDGLFVTNHHVIEGAQEIAVKLNDSSKIYTAYVDKSNAQKDLALLRLREAGPYPVLVIEETTLPELGEEILVLGYPLGTKLGLELTVSTGIVSSLRNYPEIKLIQTNAAINHGNSGGPMIYRRTGHVIGVVTAKARNSESIGFAIDVRELKQLLSER